MKRRHGLRLVRDGQSLAQELSASVNMSSPSDIAKFMQPFVEREIVEVFWVLPLTVQNQLIHSAPIVITRGILNSALVHPREVFLAAIVARANAVVLCHNHPSGWLNPSHNDREVTGQLVACGNLLSIPVLDHLILDSTGGYISFAEQGLL